MLGEMLHNRPSPASALQDGFVLIVSGATDGSNAASDLENRPADFGNGSDWNDGVSADAGAESDSGGGWD